VNVDETKHTPIWQEGNAEHTLQRDTNPEMIKIWMFNCQGIHAEAAAISTKIFT